MSCACPDVSDFRHKYVKMFLLNIWSEYQNLVKKFQAFFEDINNMQTEFPRSGMHIRILAKGFN